jgi:hypothetical protein
MDRSPDCFGRSEKLIEPVAPGSVYGANGGVSMRRILALAAIAIGLGLTSLPAANAQDLELHIGRDGPNLRMRHDCDPRREDCRGDRDRRGWERRTCTPDRALDKADRLGLRRARINDVGRRSIKVSGRTRGGDRLTIVFDRRDRRCPVIDRYIGF